MGRFSSTFNAIANAIIAKDGGGAMTPAQMPSRINAFTSGSAGNGLPYGCPRIDLIDIDAEITGNYQAIVAIDLRYISNQVLTNTRGTWQEVAVSNTGDVSVLNTYNPGQSVTFAGGGWICLRVKDVEYTTNIDTKMACVVNVYSSTYRIYNGPTNNKNFFVYAKIKKRTSSVRLQLNRIRASFVDFQCEYVADQYCFFSENYAQGIENIYGITGIYNSPVNLFYGCYATKRIDLSLCDLSPFSNNNMFNNCANLRTLIFPLQDKGPRASIDLHWSTLLTVDSLMSVINSLQDMTGQTSPTLTLGAANLAKLTDEQKAVATAKGWTLA